MFKGTSVAPDPDLASLIGDLLVLPTFDKKAMSGSCEIETIRMLEFMRGCFGMQHIDKQEFVQGVKAFVLTRPPEALKDEEEVVFGMPGEPQFIITGVLVVFCLKLVMCLRQRN